MDERTETLPIVTPTEAAPHCQKQFGEMDKVVEFRVSYEVDAGTVVMPWRTDLQSLREEYSQLQARTESEIGAAAVDNLRVECRMVTTEQPFDIDGFFS